ncbi:MAG: hypothetical protein Q8P03_00750 [bacterium]|nr:hypothetical protein [bacterium]
MKFELPLEKTNLLSIMRKAGYAPRIQTVPEEEEYSRTLSGSTYPRFHVYAKVFLDKQKAYLNLHLDQKAPSYQGTAAHGGEYEGDLLEVEVQRIRRFL